MTTPTTQRWCHACSKYEDFGGGWFALYLSRDNRCVIAPVLEREHRDQWLELVFACGQLTALVLVERYLHTGTFNPPAPAEPATQPDHFEALT